jgi:hypothetical protein
MKTQPIYKMIATKVQALANLEAKEMEYVWGDQAIPENITRWLAIHTTILEDIADKLLPSGSGFDNGTAIDLEQSKPERLVLSTSFHHMNENGFYTKWTQHEVIITPSLAFDFEIKITGRNHNGIKDYMHEVFDHALRQTVGESMDLLMANDRPTETVSL